MEVEEAKAEQVVDEAHEQTKHVDTGDLTAVASLFSADPSFQGTFVTIRNRVYLDAFDCPILRLGDQGSYKKSRVTPSRSFAPTMKWRPKTLDKPNQVKLALPSLVPISVHLFTRGSPNRCASLYLPNSQDFDMYSPFFVNKRGDHGQDHFDEGRCSIGFLTEGGFSHRLGCGFGFGFCRADALQDLRVVTLFGGQRRGVRKGAFLLFQNSRSNEFRACLLTL